MKHTVLYDEHLNLKAKMVPYAGFEMPVQYQGVTQEHFAVREHVGLFDVSHMGQFILKGPEAASLLQYLTTNDLEQLNVGKAQYSCMTNKKGGIVDDLIIYQLAEEEYMLVVNAANIEKDWNWIHQIAKEQDCRVIMQNQSEEMSLIAVQGPKAVDLVQKLTDTDVSAIPFYHFQSGVLNGLENVLISATGYTGSGGFELYMPNSYAVDIWKSLLKNGEELSVMACGLAARDTLRLEKAYCLYGNDIDEDTSPLEAGLGWITKLKTDFVARDLLLQQKSVGVSQKLMGFEMKERGIARKGYEIVDAKANAIGRVTSGTQSPMLKKGIGLGYIQTPQATLGGEIFIKIREKVIPAQLIATPFVK